MTHWDRLSWTSSARPDGCSRARLRDGVEGGRPGCSGSDTVLSTAAPEGTGWTQCVVESAPGSTSPSSGTHLSAQRAEAVSTRHGGRNTTGQRVRPPYLFLLGGQTKRAWLSSSMAELGSASITTPEGRRERWLLCAGEVHYGYVTQPSTIRTQKPAAHQNRAAGAGLQAGQAPGQQGSVAGLGVVLQGDAVRLRVLHDQTRGLGLRKAGVQSTSSGIHEVGPGRRETGCCARHTTTTARADM
ncbi:hypothetical protein EYF80_037648 [Liparis tanakae]|uniref:Uncharacterized protein n=1 Tax=Liparis tanakae TaxID=230148 RepID=A0A4Z2GFD3_9TELE|nr:hypothetical protein EYF80_037648 [Liparis tanakae]